MNKAKITIVDDSDTFRKGLRFYIENFLKHEVVAEASNGYDLIKSINTIKPDIILMDIEMPGLNGIETTKQILFDFNYKVIAVTNYDEPAYLKELVFAGFKGVILKKDLYQQLETALECVYNGDVYFPEHLFIKPESDY
jgi:two-component system, NarL family, response regulator NreC